MESAERKEWLEDAIEEHVKNNPKKDSVDIVSYFKLRVDIVMKSISFLEKEGRIKRVNLYGFTYGYVCC